MKASIEPLYSQKAPFIVFEGLDGAGTTTQLGLLKAWMERTYNQRVYATQEPTNGPIGSLLQLALRRRVQLDGGALALLFAADRVDHIKFDMQEYLEKGTPVLCDRYYLSSFAYQLRDMPDDLAWIESINAKAVRPDLTLLIDVPADICMERIQKSRWKTELFEELENLKAIRENYLMLAHHRRSVERIEVIDGNRDPQDVHQEVCDVVKEVLNY
jgi:dTMP kinase